MKKILFLLLTLSVFTSCDVPANQGDGTYDEPQESETFKKGKRQLQIQGYKNIRETSADYFCLGDDDSWLLSKGFTAEDAEGQEVEGCICVKSLLSNSVTIRFK